MAKIDQVESRARSALVRAAEFEQENEPLSAIKALQEALSFQRNRGFIKDHEKIVAEITRLAIAEQRPRDINEALRTLRFRVLNSTHEPIEAAATASLAAAAAKLARDIAEASAAPSELPILKYIYATSGLSADEVVHRRAVRTSIGLFVDVAENILNALTLSYERNAERYGGKALMPCYHSCIKTVLDVLVQHRATDRLWRFFGIIRRNMYDKMKRDINFFEAVAWNDVCEEEIVNTLQRFLHAATELRSWRTVSVIIEQTTETTSHMNNCGRPMRPQTFQMIHDNLARLFADCEMPAYHSYSMLCAARLVRDPAMRPMAASCAVLSVLCIPAETEAVAEISQGHDRVREKNVELMRKLNMTTMPTRASLAQSIGDLLDAALPEVRQLYAVLFETKSVHACREAKPLLERIAAIPQLARYCEPIKRTAVESLLEIVSATFATVPLEYFVGLCAFYSADEFHTRLEPVLLRTADAAETGNTVQVDMRNSSLTFAPVQSRSEGRVAAFAHSLQTVAARCEPYVTKRAPPRPARFSLETFDAERQRALARTLLANIRSTNEEQRKAALLERERKRRQDEIDAITRIEKARHERNLEAARKKLLAEAQVAENVERQKWVLESLLSRNKGIVLPPSLAELPPERFANEITRRFTAYRKGQEHQKNSDVRQMDHLERAIRAEEIPRREQLARDAAAIEAQNREETVRNLRAKHRADHELAVATKHRLAALRAQREAEESAAQHKPGRAKMTKREEQDALLQQEKRAREAEHAAIHAAKAASSAPAAEKDGADAAATGAGGGPSAGGASAPPAAAAAAAAPPRDGGDAGAAGAPAKAVWKPKGRQ